MPSARGDGEGGCSAEDQHLALGESALHTTALWITSVPIPAAVPSGFDEANSMIMWGWFGLAMGWCFELVFVGPGCGPWWSSCCE